MRIGPWQLQPYSLRLGWGVLAGLIWLWGAAPRYGLRRDQSVALLWSVVGGALLMGRMGYVAGNFSYFAQHPWAVVQVGAAGGIHGGSAWAGGLAALLLWSCRRPAARQAALGLVTPAALAVAAGAWWGCAEAGCAWGREVASVPAWARWTVVSAPDLYHLVAQRYAVQGAAALWAVGLIPLAVVLKRRGAWAAVLYLVGEAALTWWRADPVPLVGRWRADFWLDVGLAVGLAAVQGWAARPVSPSKVTVGDGV